MEPASSQQLSITDLPIGTMAHVSSFLPLPSRALFAVALNCRDVERSSIIVGEQRDVLDFGEVEKDLAAKLSDADVKGVLLSVDAIHNIKVLLLTNCINISGAGLEPLRASAIIEKIDLSLVGDHESPKLYPEPPISCDEIIPILDSIIARGEECSLKLLEFPKKWRDERSTESDFHAFLTRYDAYLSTQAPFCFECNTNLSEDMLAIIANQDAYGKQYFTCHDCLTQYCYDCKDEEGGVDYIGGLCLKCERVYCLHCKAMKMCENCELWHCVDCNVMKQCFVCECNLCVHCCGAVAYSCCKCEKVWCGDGDCDQDVYGCEQCNEEICCPDCGHVTYCNDCDTYRCDHCLISKCNGGCNCAGCYQLAYTALLRDNERMQTEINELKREVEDLRVNEEED